MMEVESISYESDKDFLNLLLDASKTQSNISLKYNEVNFLFHPMGEKIYIYINDSEEIFNSFDDFVERFTLDGKSFMVLLPYIDFA